MVTKENDRYEWMRETAEHLRNDEIDEIDPKATADWFDEVRRSDRHEVVSRLRLIIRASIEGSPTSRPGTCAEPARVGPYGRRTKGAAHHHVRRKPEPAQSSDA